jgi:PAS domain S-box-containing protein
MSANPMQLHLERLIACSRDILVVCERDGTLIAANEALTRILGWTVDEIMAEGLEGIVHPDDLAETRATLARIDSEPVRAFTNRQRTASGAWVWVEWTGQRDGDYLYFVGRDITDRKAAEDEARIIHDRYVESQLIGRVGHWRRDLRSETVTWSRGVFAIFGLDPDAFTTEYTGIIDLIDPRDRHIVIEALQRIAATGQPETYYLRFRRADGERVLWNQGHRETDADGTPTAVFGVVRDVTEEQTRLDALIEERRKALELMELAQTASLAKSRFLANMSHELRTPLNAIIGFSEMMTLETFGPMPPAYADYTRHVLDSARFLLSLIDDILDLARVEAGRHDINPTDLDVAQEIDACLKTVAPKARDHGLTLRSEIASDTGLLVADQRAARQILLNLLSNALKFTPSGGMVTVRAEAHPRGGVRVMVADTGIGIPEADHDRVFNPFDRSTEAEQGAIQGTGLGLTLVKALVDLHGGHISLNSAPGCGTTVIVHFPGRDGADEAGAAASAVPVGLA